MAINKLKYTPKEDWDMALSLHQKNDKELWDLWGKIHGLSEGIDYIIYIAYMDVWNQYNT